MGASAIPKMALLGFITCNGFSQTPPPADPLASRSLKIDGVPVLEVPARDYQRFFDEVRYWGQKTLSADARKKLDLTNQELRSLVTITADLAIESEFFQKTVRPYVFESRMEATESGSISPALEQKLNELRDQWATTVLDHARRLKAAFGEDRFRPLDEFVRSGKSTLEKPLASSDATSSLRGRKPTCLVLS